MDNRPDHDKLDEVRRLAAAAAGIAVPEDRLPALTDALENVRRIGRSLAAVDYGHTEPAARFRPSGGRDQ